MPNQSACKSHHSVETALVYLHNDILRAMDNQNIVTMMVLNLSAAFDSMGHNDKVQSVHINGYTSPACGIDWDKCLGDCS